MPINRVQRALVQDECCSKYCTVRDIYNKYCLNKKYVPNRRGSPFDKRFIRERAPSLMSDGFSVTIVAVDVVPKRKRKNRTTTTTTAAAIISTIAATTTTPTPRATDSAATTLRTVTTATCYGLLLFFVASRWPMFVAR